MAAPLDLVGVTFGDLTAIRVSPSGQTPRKWECLCICGNTVEVLTGALRSGNTRSCGCGHKKPKISTHGASGTRLYICFTSMHSRCDSPTCKSYPFYGGKGIAVCKEWATFEPFQEWALASGYSDDLTLDRKNTDGGYEPSNCRWATATTQTRNRNAFSGGTSKYMGVSWNQQYSKWNSTICIDYKAVQLGRFTDEVEAAKARDAYIIQNGLQDFVLNFK